MTPSSGKMFVPEASILPHVIYCVFNFNFLAPVVSEIIGGPKFTLRGLAPLQTPPSGKNLTHPQVLAYTYINVMFQRRISINVRLTEGSLYNRFRIERSPKIGFWGDFGVGAKTFGGKVHLSSELRVFRHFWSISGGTVACMGIAICHR